MNEKPFEYNTDLVSKNAFTEHFKLYQEYIQKYNQIQNEFTETYKANKNYSPHRGKKVDESYNLNSVILHELFFNNITHEEQSGQPSKKFCELTEKHFKGFNSWQMDFIAAANASRGWCACVWEQRTETISNILYDSHNTGIIQNSYPLIIIDVYEHAYFIDYGKALYTYIQKFMKCINWSIVDKRAEAI